MAIMSNAIQERFFQEFHESLNAKVPSFVKIPDVHVMDQSGLENHMIIPIKHSEFSSCAYLLPKRENDMKYTFTVQHPRQITSERITEDLTRNNPVILVNYKTEGVETWKFFVHSSLVDKEEFIGEIDPNIYNGSVAIGRLEGEQTNGTDSMVLTTYDPKVIPKLIGHFKKVKSAEWQPGVKTRTDVKVSSVKL